MGKPESLRNNFLMKGTTNTSASQRTQVRWIDGSYLMIYAYKTQDIASCKTLGLIVTLEYMHRHREASNYPWAHVPSLGDFIVTLEYMYHRKEDL